MKRDLQRRDTSRSMGNAFGKLQKTHLVPFGEYVPMEKFLFFASPLVETVGSFEPGDDLSPIDLYGVRLG